MKIFSWFIILLEHTSQRYYPASRVRKVCSIITEYYPVNGAHSVMSLLHRSLYLCTHWLNIIAEILSCECCSKYFSRWWNDFMFLKKSKWNQTMVSLFRIHFDFLEKWKSEMILQKYFRGSDKLLEHTSQSNISVSRCKQRVYILLDHHSHSNIL